MESRLDVPHSVNNFDIEFIQCRPVMDNNLFQLVRQATRNNNILDLVLLTDNDKSIHPTIVPKFIASDHECLQISVIYRWLMQSAKVVNKIF